MKKAAIVLSLCFLFTSVGVGQDEELLDLIALKAAKASQVHDEPTAGGGGGYGGERLAPSPLKITLALVDKSIYRIDDQIVYEVVVENVSQEKVLLPKSLDGSDEEFAASAQYLANYSAYSNVYLSLEAETELSKYPESFTGIGLYGAETRPGSLKILSPGQKLRIRASGSVRFINSGFFAKLAAELPKKCEVRASLTFFHFRNQIAILTQQFQSAVSTNSVAVELHKYEPPNQSPSQ